MFFYTSVPGHGDEQNALDYKKQAALEDVSIFSL